MKRYRVTGIYRYSVEIREDDSFVLDAIVEADSEDDALDAVLESSAGRFMDGEVVYQDTGGVTVEELPEPEDPEIVDRIENHHMMQLLGPEIAPPLFAMEMEE